MVSPLVSFSFTSSQPIDIEIPEMSFDSTEVELFPVSERAKREMRLVSMTVRKSSLELVAKDLWQKYGYKVEGFEF
jgi:hypothetical protein